MPRLEGNRSKMLKELSAFKRKHGHCNVPANFDKDPRLGRWVAAQRYRGRLGELSEEEVAELRELGFVWSPSDAAWDKVFSALVEFKKKHRHCDVPERWVDNRSLANWVQNQRNRKKKGKLSQDRIDRLEQMGFCWRIYKGDETDEVHEEETYVEPAECETCEKLYSLGNGVYVQYSGEGKLPGILETYVKRHRGEFPAYIPLPMHATVFYMGERFVCEKTVKWKGRGALPRVVTDYVKENGTLPRHD